ncbi:MAG: hypothetical protein MUO76_18325 [Anaerolineaceae bacterium]|nr:hypothetical protein [Anaerolineaceae bacterium]
MLVIRSVFQAKYGKGGDLVALFKEAENTMPEMSDIRILTDATGPMFTVVYEQDAENFADWEERRGKIFSHPDFGDWFARMEPLVETGHREFYYIE